MNEADPIEETLVAAPPANDSDALETPVCDERYPGTFFTIPAPIVLGKTAWSLT
jgi:hypothetical protein